MNIKNILLGTLVSLAAVSCVYEDTSKHVISTDKAIYEIGKEGGEVVLMLTSPKDWTATIAPATSLDNIEGITVVPSSGKGSSKPIEVKIIAESNDGENYKRSALISFMADNISTAVNLVQEGGKERPAEKITIGDFLKKPIDAGVYYQLTGTVTGAKEDDKYSNCTLVDETGSVLIYGLGLEKGGSTDVKTFEVKGVKNGDLLTIETTRGDYKGTPQGVNSYYISHEAGKFEEFDVNVKSFDVVSFGTSVSFDVKAGDNVEWTIKADNGFTTNPSSGKGNGNVTVSFVANIGEELNEGKVIVTTEANVQTNTHEVVIRQNAPSQDVTYTKVNNVSGGKSYLLVSTKDAEAKTAMPLMDKNYGYLSSTAFAKKGEDIVMCNEQSAFKFTVVDGGYTVQQSDNKYLYGTSEYNTFNVSAEIPESGHVFSVEPQADATVKITCVATGKWLQYGEGKYTSFGLYDSEKGNPIMLYEAK